MTREYKCNRSFIEIVNPKDIIVDSVEPYDKLIECFDNEECRDRYLRIGSIPLEFNKNIGDYTFKDSPNLIRLTNKNGKLKVHEGKHRVLLAKQRKIDKLVAYVEYQCD